MKFALILIISILFVPQTWASIYQDAKNHFSFEYDEQTWQIAPEKPLSSNPAEKGDPILAQKTLVTLQSIKADEKYHSRFSVVRDEIDKFKETGPALLVAYHKHAVDFLKKNGFAIKSTDLTKLPGTKSDAGQIIATQSNFGLTFKQVVLIHEGHAYLLTAATRTARFDEQVKETERFFNTFQFTKK